MSDTATATPPLKAFHGDAQLKEQLLDQVELHRKADEIVGGAYFEKTGGKLQACGIGCIMHDPDGGHMAMAERLNIPPALVYLYEGIFEALPRGEQRQKDFPGQFLAAIEVGADLTNIWPRFAAWMMLDEEWGLAPKTENEEVKAICKRVGEAYQRMDAGEIISDEEADEIARAAWAAWAARDAWDAWDARDAYVAASSEKLIELLSAATSVAAEEPAPTT